MKPIWKLKSGQFYGWINEIGSVYRSNGRRIGTAINKVVYDSRGKYLGELIEDRYLGTHPYHLDWEGPSCYTEDRIEAEPMINLIGMDLEPWVDPKS